MPTPNLPQVQAQVQAQPQVASQLHTGTANLHVPLPLALMHERGLWARHMASSAIGPPAAPISDCEPPGPDPSIPSQHDTTPVSVHATQPSPALPRVERDLCLSGTVKLTVFKGTDRGFAVAVLTMDPALHRWIIAQRPVPVTAPSPTRNGGNGGKLPFVRGLPPVRQFAYRREARDRLDAIDGRPTVAEVVVMGNGFGAYANPGTPVHIRGHWVQHAVHGWQVVVQHVQMESPSDLSDMGMGLADPESGIPLEAASVLTHRWGLSAASRLDAPDGADALLGLGLPGFQTSSMCQEAKEKWDAWRAVSGRAMAPRNGAADKHLRDAEQSKKAVVDIEDLVSPVDLLGLKWALMKLDKREQAARAGVSLSVTELTSMLWCALQQAYQLATGEQKKTTFFMAQGSAIHEGLELAVVQKVEVKPVTAEDEQAIVLVNMIAAIRQVVVEGRTRELRLFARLGSPWQRSPWISGVVDGVDWDAKTGLVTLTETKTRGTPKPPGQSQKDSAKLQVMIYREMFNEFRKLTLEEVREYLYHHSNTGVGLRPDFPLSPDLAEVCAPLLTSQGPPNPVASPQTPHQSTPAAQVVIDLTGHSQASPTAASAQAAHEQHATGAAEGEALSQQLSQHHISPDAQQGHTQQQPPSQERPFKTSKLVHDDNGNDSTHEQPRTPEPSVQGAGVAVLGIGGADAVMSSPSQPQGVEADDIKAGAVVSGCQSSTIGDDSGGTGPHRDSAEARGDALQGGGQGATLLTITLDDLVRVLHQSLAWLPPAGDSGHRLEYIYQQDPTGGFLLEEEVVFDSGWLRERLQPALAVWTGRAAPQPCASNERYKCNYCDFKSQCKVYKPSHPDSNPATVAERTLAARRERNAAAARTQTAEPVLAP